MMQAELGSEGAVRRGPATPASSRPAEVIDIPYVAGALTRPADARRQSALYRVVRDGKVAYLYGTIHVGAKEFYPLAPEVDSALAHAGTLVLELDTRSDDAFVLAVAKHGSYGPGDNIARHLSADTLASLTQALHALGITLNSMAHFKPWLMANILIGFELERSGYARQHGIESFLLTAANAKGIDVAELESADYQLALFNTLDDAAAERYLREALRDLSDGTSLRQARATIDAWNSGDADALDNVITTATSGDTVLSEFTRSTLLGKRNPEMASRIELIMKDGKTAFVAIGLLHLLGTSGLPQLMSQRGYQVERMY
jgi:uncharacterized protein YbaP (TraB family)